LEHTFVLAATLFMDEDYVCYNMDEFLSGPAYNGLDRNVGPQWIKTSQFVARLKNYLGQLG